MLGRSSWFFFAFFMALPLSTHIFCRVVDNFGDIGVCWRLARQLHAEHAVAVTLWVDDLRSFQRLCRAIDVTKTRQQVEGVEVRYWSPDSTDWQHVAMPELVIEAFACDLPDAYVAAMAQASRKPVWLNLEYLSAEAWVEGCHALPSPHPVLPLTKYFFFPGFSKATGGLLREADLLERRDAFQASRAVRNRFLDGLGVDTGKLGQASLVSLFCYPNAPVTSLFDAWTRSSKAVLCLVPEGVAMEQVGHFVQQVPHAGAAMTQGQLTVQVIPFLDQSDYDRLLWSCDLNLVRGEDSMVRAQWAGRPFVWQIYPQQEDAHWPKLGAFLDRYVQGMPTGLAAVLRDVWLQWNGAPAKRGDWDSLQVSLPALSAHARSWVSQLIVNGDLASNLLRFTAKIG